MNRRDKMVATNNFVIMLMISVLLGASAFEMPLDERFKAGEKSLQDFQAKARHSDCWKKAIENLHVGCKKLTDIEQSYLAVEFTNCHLKKSGKRTYNCSRDKSIEECTGSMDDLSFNAYTTFFTHTTNICFYLQSLAWQEKTEDTVSKLSETSEEVAGQLENSIKNQLLVLKHQNQSLQNQKEIIVHEKKLSMTLKSSTSEARQAFDEMKTKANEQRAIFTNTFEGIFKSVENIKQLQAMILGEFITLQSLAFHFVAICVCYFFTSSPRTANARLGLFIGLAFLIGIERIITSWSIGDGDSTDTEFVHFRLWMCRKIFIFTALLGLLWVAYKYQDLNKINHTMLLEIQKQIHDLKYLQSMDPNIQSITDGTPIPMTALTVSKSWAGSHHQITQKGTDVPDSRDGEESSQNEAEDSYDETYVQQNHDDDESSSSASSDYESLNSESIADLNINNSSFAVKQDFENETSTPTKGRWGSGQPSSTPKQSRSRSRTSRASLTPSHSYNLRPRRSNQFTPYSSSFMNMPSPSTLEELVKSLKKSTMRYTAVMKKDKVSGKQLFSSDDES